MPRTATCEKPMLEKTMNEDRKAGGEKFFGMGAVARAAEPPSRPPAVRAAVW